LNCFYYSRALKALEIHLESLKVLEFGKFTKFGRISGRIIYTIVLQTNILHTLKSP
jgi:hypothetical protein